MSAHPYSPPKVEQQAPRAKKPVAAWILQLAASPAAALALLYGVLAPLHAIDSGNTTSGLVGGAVCLALAVLCVAAVVAIQRRSPVARWLGSAFIVLFMLLSLWVMMPSSYHGEPYDWGAGRLIGMIVVLALEAWWLYAVAWSAKARRYFNVHST